MSYASSFAGHSSRSSRRGSFAPSRSGFQRSGGWTGRAVKLSRGGGRGGNQMKTLDVNYLIRKTEELIAQAAAAHDLPASPVVNTFADFAVGSWLHAVIAARGYSQPTPIQDQAIPHLLNGKDVVGIANTGTGKTAAFLIPLLHKIATDRSQRVLIMAPTRELAAQIKQEAALFTAGQRIYSALCIGGVNMQRQIDALRRRPEIVIGTPGRLKDLNLQRVLDFSQFTTLVLDEVDRMLDMGFINDMRFIIQQLPRERQSVFFSATMSSSVEQVMTAFSSDAIKISVKTQETALNVRQEVIRLNGRDKVQVLTELLSQEEVEKVIIFGRTKRGVENLARKLGQHGHRIEALHGNKTQGQRIRALEAFKTNRVSVLLATDVAARGLDIADVTHVINYDLPATYEEYVHRIGRTGRADKKGVALSLVN